ncbi:pyridoxamine 5'-phosphate oxidase-domain-containing protein [Microdochium bolleyi]|uniref:Pyridoxamine 5'-phosphate oxidase-domain-containing protein n=1 Tax=Microdochium bolleyi TaxID=196109 RepID=A0A136JDW1_9PEZI|nr:pyridoxamine 5'-phosphate oxidase-domain-containing protein [Microdochium bolleyi]
MSSTTTAPAAATKQPAPWRDLFLEHVNAMPSPEFSLSTIRRVRRGSSGGGGVTLEPRVRTCIFRGLWADLPVNSKNEAELNPPGVWTSDLPVFTTDARMDKMAELFDVEADADAAAAASSGEKTDDERVRGSGGGAAVEAMFWVKESMVQWRIRGRAYVLAPDDVDDGGSEAGDKTVRTIMQRMRKPGPGDDDDDDNDKGKSWSFRREIAAQFENLSPGMRGTWRNPPSGRPIELPVEDPRLKLGQKTGSLVADDLARQNFRVVVIVPDFVDRCDLSDPARGRRWFYTFLGGQAQAKTPGGQVEGEWEKVEVWP